MPSAMNDPPTNDSDAPDAAADARRTAIRAIMTDVSLTPAEKHAKVQSLMKAGNGPGQQPKTAEKEDDAGEHETIAAVARKKKPPPPPPPPPPEPSSSSPSDYEARIARKMASENNDSSSKPQATKAAAATSTMDDRIARKMEAAEKNNPTTNKPRAVAAAAATSSGTVDDRIARKIAGGARGGGGAVGSSVAEGKKSRFDERLARKVSGEGGASHKAGSASASSAASKPTEGDSFEARLARKAAAASASSKGETFEERIALKMSSGGGGSTTTTGAAAAAAAAAAATSPEGESFDDRIALKMKAGASASAAAASFDDRLALKMSAGSSMKAGAAAAAASAGRHGSDDSSADDLESRIQEKMHHGSVTSPLSSSMTSVSSSDRQRSALPLLPEVADDDDDNEEEGIKLAVKNDPALNIYGEPTEVQDDDGLLPLNAAAAAADETENADDPTRRTSRLTGSSVTSYEDRLRSKAAGAAAAEEDDDNKETVERRRTSREDRRAPFFNVRNRREASRRFRDGRSEALSSFASSSDGERSFDAEGDAAAADESPSPERGGATGKNAIGEGAREKSDDAIDDDGSVGIPEATPIEAWVGDDSNQINLDDVHEAEIVVEDKYSITLGGRKVGIKYLVLAILIVLGAVIALSVSLSGGGNDRAVYATAPPTTSSRPSPVPTGSPSVSAVPSSRPSDAPSMTPTAELRMGFVPTLTGLTSRAVFDDDDSPQSKAVAWLVNEGDVSLVNETRRLVQRYVLLVLYYSTGGEDWDETKNFLSGGLHECAWNDGDGGQGAFCDDDGEIVTSIILDDNDLEGTIPREVTALTNLTRLTLSNNDLGGTIIDEIASLDKLSVLELHRNDFTGSIPQSLGDMKGLTTLKLYRNELSGRLPSVLGNLTNLEVLDLSYNKLVGKIPPSFGNLISIEQMRLSYNQLSGQAPTEFTNLPSIDTLYINNNDIIGSLSFICDANPSIVMLADCVGPNPRVNCTCCAGCNIENDESCPEGQHILEVEVNTDNFGTETTWLLVDAANSDAFVMSGGPYSSNAQYIRKKCISSSGRYEFTINDEYGDGMLASQGGNYKLSMPDAMGGYSFYEGGVFSKWESVSWNLTESGVAYNILVSVPQPTQSPTSSSAPSVSSSPTQTPTVSSAPTVSAAPSLDCEATCLDYLLNQGDDSSGVKTLCPTGPNGITFDVYCDQTTDGGGWMLLYAYVRSGDNPVLNYGTLPTDPDAGFSHVHVKDLLGDYSVDDVEKVRFYCDTDRHDRVMHFTSSHPIIRGIAYDGNLGYTENHAANSVFAWAASSKELSDHTAFLPRLTNAVSADNAVSGFTGANTFFTGNLYHWNIRKPEPQGYTRWDCDDWYKSAEYDHDTKHLVYARLNTRLPEENPTASPAPSVSLRPSSSEECEATCLDFLQMGDASSGVKTICPEGRSGPVYEVYCDQTTDGGGWMLIYAYNHEAGTNPDLVPGVVPTHPNNSSHIHLNDLAGYSAEHIEATRFYCESTRHNRVIHFTSSDPTIGGIAYDGQQFPTDSHGQNSADLWTSSASTLLPDHTANLPFVTRYVFNGNGEGFLDDPFHTGGHGKSYWSIKSYGDRWRCDDDSKAEHDTKHLVYVRLNMQTKTPTVSPAPTDSPKPSLFPSLSSMPSVDFSEVFYVDYECLSWHEHKAKAESMCMTLASITSQAEMDYVEALTARYIGSDFIFWIGAQSNNCSSDTFGWVDGSNWTYSAWHPSHQFGYNDECESVAHLSIADESLGGRYWRDDADPDTQFRAVYRKGEAPVEGSCDGSTLTPLGTCGGGNVGNGVCLDCRCCSEFGWCGSGEAYCGPPPTPQPTSAAPTSSPQPTETCDGVKFKYTIDTDQWGGETTWEVTDLEYNSIVMSGGPYAGDSSYAGAECLSADRCYVFTIQDSYGDGMCCACGNGQYSLFLDDVFIFSGGQFSSSESTQITYGCENDESEEVINILDESEWELVAHMSSEGGMFDGDGNLQEIYSYGTFVALENLTETTSDFQRPFPFSDAKDILFITGDGSIWAMTDYPTLSLIINEGTATPEPNIALRRQINNVASVVEGNVYSRPGTPEDPLISISNGTHSDGVAEDLIVWGENDHPSYTNLKGNHGGINVFVRPNIAPAIETISVEPEVVGLITISVSFSDVNFNDSHVCMVDPGDGSDLIVGEIGGVMCKCVHSYLFPGTYAVGAIIVDDAGAIDFSNSIVNIE